MGNEKERTEAGERKKEGWKKDERQENGNRRPENNQSRIIVSIKNNGYQYTKTGRAIMQKNFMAK